MLHILGKVLLCKVRNQYEKYENMRQTLFSFINTNFMVTKLNI